MFSGKNTLRPQQLNINVATWVRLLKRDVPQQPTAEDEESSSPPPQPATGTGQQSGVRRDSPSDIQQLAIESRVDETVPALPPKQSKYSTESSTVSSGVIGGSGERTTPALPPRIDTDIEVCTRLCEGLQYETPRYVSYVCLSIWSGFPGFLLLCDAW